MVDPPPELEGRLYSQNMRMMRTKIEERGGAGDEEMHRPLQLRECGAMLQKPRREGLVSIGDPPVHRGSREDLGSLIPTATQGPSKLSPFSYAAPSSPLVYSPIISKRLQKRMWKLRLTALRATRL